MLEHYCRNGAVAHYRIDGKPSHQNWQEGHYSKEVKWQKKICYRSLEERLWQVIGGEVVGHWKEEVGHWRRCALAIRRYVIAYRSLEDMWQVILEEMWQVNGRYVIGHWRICGSLYWSRCGRSMEAMLQVTGGYVVSYWRRCGRSFEDMLQGTGGNVVGPWRRCGRSLEDMLQVTGGQVVGNWKICYRSLEDMSQLLEDMW